MPPPFHGGPPHFPEHPPGPFEPPNRPGPEPFRPPFDPPGFFRPPCPIVPVLYNPQAGQTRAEVAFYAFWSAAGGVDPFSGQPLPATLELMAPEIQAVFEAVGEALSRPLL